MRESGIMMSGPMVRATLENRKTKTRRVVIPQPIAGSLPGGKYEASNPWVDANGEWHFMRGVVCRGEDDVGRCRYGVPGDRLWVTTTRRGAFAKLWDSLNAKRGYSWESNPWVWVLEFRRVSTPISTNPVTTASRGEGTDSVTREAINA